MELHLLHRHNALSGAPIQDFAGFRIYRSATGKPGSFDILAEVTDRLSRYGV